MKYEIKILGHKFWWLNLKAHVVFWRASIAIWRANIKINRIQRELNRLYAQIDANNKAKGLEINE